MEISTRTHQVIAINHDDFIAALQMYFTSLGLNIPEEQLRQGRFVNTKVDGLTGKFEYESMDTFNSVEDNSDNNQRSCEDNSTDTEQLPKDVPATIAESTSEEATEFSADDEGKEDALGDIVDQVMSNAEANLEAEAANEPAVTKGEPLLANAVDVPPSNGRTVNPLFGNG